LTDRKRETDDTPSERGDNSKKAQGRSVGKGQRGQKKRPRRKGGRG